MRVCMLAYTFYEGDNRVRRYAEALVKRGDTVDIVAVGRDGQAPRITIAGVNVFRIQTRRIDEKSNLDYLVKVLLFLLRSFVFLSWRHLRKPYQLIHVHSVPDFEVFAAVVAKVAGARVILDIHDIVPEFYAGKFSGGKGSMFSRALMLVERMCCAFSDHVIISNHLWAETLVSRSVQKSKCSVMLNYPDPAIFRSDLPHRKDSTFRMIYPGTLSHHQGVDVAIRALARLKNSLGRFRFDIYGRGSDEDMLKGLAISLGLSAQVHFHGIVPLEEVAAQMALSDLGVIPKRADGFGNEAFSTKIFEFMALGVPVVISSTKVDRFYFNDSIVAFFESGSERELADRILELARSDSARDAMAVRASTFIAQYSWDARKGEYFALVDSLVHRTHSGPAVAPVPDAGRVLTPGASIQPVSVDGPLGDRASIQPVSADGTLGDRASIQPVSADGPLGDRASIQPVSADGTLGDRASMQPVSADGPSVSGSGRSASRRASRGHERRPV